MQLNYRLIFFYCCLILYNSGIFLSHLPSYRKITRLHKKLVSILILWRIEMLSLRSGPLWFEYFDVLHCFHASSILRFKWLNFLSHMRMLLLIRSFPKIIWSKMWNRRYRLLPSRLICSITCISWVKQLKFLIPRRGGL